MKTIFIQSKTPLLFDAKTQSSAIIYFQVSITPVQRRRRSDLQVLAYVIMNGTPYSVPIKGTINYGEGEVHAYITDALWTQLAAGLFPNSDQSFGIENIHRVYHNGAVHSLNELGGSGIQDFEVVEIEEGHPDWNAHNTEMIGPWHEGLIA